MLFSVFLFKSYLYPLHFLGLFITSGLFTLMQLWHIFHRICQFAIFYYLEDDGVFLIKNLLDTIFPSHQSLFIWELISMLSIEYFLTIVKLYIQTPPQLLVCLCTLASSQANSGTCSHVQDKCFYSKWSMIDSATTITLGN